MKFQIERIALFSDAVFAIAATLMIIEVKAPHIPHHATFNEALSEVLKLTPLYMGVVLSFFLIGVFWMRHHQLLKYLTDYTPKLLYINLALLLSIAFIPFSTALVFENLLSGSPVPLIVYNLNYIVATTINYTLFRYVLNPANQVSGGSDLNETQLLKSELIFPLFVYVTVIILALITPYYAFMGYAMFALEGWYVKWKNRNQVDRKVVARENELQEVPGDKL